MKQAEEEIQMKDNDPTLLETTGVGSVEEMKKMYLSYRKDIAARIRRAEVTGKVVWGCLWKEKESTQWDLNPQSLAP